MKINRRNPEASSLRAFFQEQWEILLEILDNWQEERYLKQWEQERLIDAVETIVEATEPKLRLAESYRQRLRDSASGLLHQVENLVDGLPPAIELSRESFVKDPWVNALFKDSSVMHRLFSSNRAVRAFFEDSDNAQCDEVFALLIAHRTEKRVLGAELRGDIIISGVEQTSVRFSGHQLEVPSSREAQVRSGVKQIIFDSVIEFLRHRMTRLKYEQAADGRLVIRSAWGNPEYYLEQLREQMHVPHSLIHLHDDQFRINSMGIKVAADVPGNANVFALQELGIGDQPVRVVSLVRYPRRELQPLSELESFKFL